MEVRLRGLACLMALGVVLSLCILQSELLWLPASWDFVDRVVYRCAFLLIGPFRLIVAQFLPRTHHHWSLAHMVVSSLGTPFFYAACYVAALKVYRRVSRRVRNNPQPLVPTAMPRRQFLVRTATMTAGLAVTSVSGYASVIEPSRLKIRNYDIAIADLPKDLDGLRLIHVSDTHYGPFTGATFLNEVVAEANALEGDLVLLTGDYVHFTPRSIEPGISLIGGFKSRLGAVAVLGNHEHWEGAQACRRVFDKIGLPLIDNGHIFLSVRGLSETPVPGNSICLAGLGDLWEDEILIDKALADVPPDMARIVLAHNPDTAEMVESRHRVDLMLCGHTHGGQIDVPLVGPHSLDSPTGQKYLGGLCHGPHCPVIVSRGIGTAFVPVRFRVPPELGVITLVRTVA